MRIDGPESTRGFGQRYSFRRAIDSLDMIRSQSANIDCESVISTLPWGSIVPDKNHDSNRDTSSPTPFAPPVEIVFSKEEEVPDWLRIEEDERQERPITENDTSALLNDESEGEFSNPLQYGRKIATGAFEMILSSIESLRNDDDEEEELVVSGNKKRSSFVVSTYRAVFRGRQRRQRDVHVRRSKGCFT